MLLVQRCHNCLCVRRRPLQVDAWAQSNTIPGLFTGSTGATVLTSEELSSSGPQAWLKKVPQSGQARVEDHTD